MNARTKVTLLAAALLALGGCGGPCHIPYSTYQKPVVQAHQRGDRISPLKSFDFAQGEWAIYVELSRDDYSELPPGVIHARCLKTTDSKLMQHMAQTWNFTYTGGDMATVGSGIYVVKDGKLLYQSGIVISRDGSGLQSEDYGWLEPVDKAAIPDALRAFQQACR